jgi:hypothetical protein
LLVWTVCADFLDLSDNFLNGTIPSEISSLVTLCEFVGRLSPLSFVLEQGALMNILLVCSFVLQILYLSMPIFLRAPTHAQKIFRSAGYPVLLIPQYPIKTLVFPKNPMKTQQMLVAL